ncbi:MAG: hypothetical protein L0H29_01785 [Sinobacteraceae bacterium]|nr:hypothetical protein [Nevskiaceae bacterium]
MNTQGYGISRELAPVQAGGPCAAEGVTTTVQFWPSDTFNLTDIASAPSQAWSLILEYQDVFGTRFYTAHHKDPLQPWTTYGVGPAPRASLPRVSAVVQGTQQ